ncbi:hypothetical protein [Adhaeretor mobilis]|nr:hypothetical protein [Adhaeretor mobilis]
MPATCEALGLTFDYPDNWQLEDSSEEAEAIMLAGPETAFWQISRHPAGTELESLFDEALSALRAEYQQIEAHAAPEQSFEGTPLTGFDVNFYCLDFTNTAWLRGFSTPEAVYLLICQAEDREMTSTAPIFQAMLTSLFRQLDSQVEPRDIPSSL